MSAGLIISVLSQKGGVGKSTLARLIARTYAAAGWVVVIADFHTKQKTSFDWVERRVAAGIEPVVHAVAATSIREVMKLDYDLIVCDGRPVADPQALDIAKASHLIVIPVGGGIDDLEPTVLFANALRAHGIRNDKIFFVVNSRTDSLAYFLDARKYVMEAGYKIATVDLFHRTVYSLAHNTGRAASETIYATLNDRAEEIVEEIVKQVAEVQGR